MVIIWIELRIEKQSIDNRIVVINTRHLVI